MAGFFSPAYADANMPGRFKFSVSFDQLLIVWLTAAALVAWNWPKWFGSVPDPFGATAGYLDYLFALTMFAIGWLLPRDEIEQVRRRWPMVLAGTTLQYSSMPFLAWSLGLLLGLDEDARLGLILVGCVPDAMASGVLTLSARGNVSYAVSLTTASTLLSPIVVPFALEMFLGSKAEFDALNEAKRLTLIVVLPVLVGHALARMWPRAQRVISQLAPGVANFTIIWIIGVVAANNREKELPTAHLLAALLLLNVLGYAAGYFGGRLFRLPAPMTRALTLVVGMQNAGLGAVIATRLFDDRPAVAIPSAMFTLISVYSAMLLVVGWRQWDAWRTTPRQ
jgi:BASS family bile acid:Na+ symporter